MDRVAMNTFFVLLLVFALPASILAQEAPSGAVDKKLNPHTGKGNCQVCHTEAEESLNAWSLFGSSKRRMKADHNTICIQCHGVQFGHGVGKVPETNVDDLPLDENGKIACALTCHSIHIQAKDPTQNHYHLRFPVNRICESCHHNNR